ncbi:putative Antibiotic ABC transporter, permease protein [[Clostridium] ultunense Esp]|uniref:Putative Antibiotic ABC transporter, permease protein n=1 Tax=[Clostridium] ultunense Esp TaxID=1288971 RepID=M1Z5V8_9FIRM|nr:MMPL family transporter [Schnuerera ultunensis]CCQ92958.1 putative Antibiotic ABC transporter, permease protein [[Clostridium] ultunense Esp]SHD78434.1 putative Antibiotic ABC transporter, permease protein [[Clostridium] ultunense Esp]
MDILANFVVNHKKFILILYIIFIVSSFIGNNYVEINYDLSTYLPLEANSIKGKNILEEEFDINGIAFLMMKDKSLPEVEKVVKTIESMEEVKDIIWLGTGEDILKPESFMDDNIKEEFLSENSNLIQIRFINSNDSLETVEAIGKIQKIVGKSGYVGGPAALSKDMQTITKKEVVYYSIIAFVIISIILFMSMESFVEPILFFIAIGVAIILNMGTNIVFDSISFTTHSVASIIQLAVSMDYSIFLLHRYIEEKTIQKNKEQAMVKAIGKTFNSIISSSLTTIGGFLALISMNYGIGKDIGLVLAKGVFFSLISVITLLPILILIFDRQIEKYRHRILLPNFKKSSRFIVKNRYVFLVVVILITIPSFLAQANVEYYYADEKILPESTDFNVANREIDRLFSNKNQLTLIVPKGDKLKEFNLIDKLTNIEEITEVKGLYSLVDITIPEDFIPEDVKTNFQSEKYTLINMNINLPIEGKSTDRALNSIKETVSKIYDEWYLTGEAAIYSDLQRVTSKDFKNVTILSIAIISGIILIASKSLTLPIILVFVIQLGIWINLAIPYFQGTSLNFIAFIIIGAIQLGATVDYAILYTSRFKENLEILPNKEKAAIKTIEDTGRPILTSALILFTGTLSVYLITSMRNAAELTLLIGRGAIISLILVLVALPSILIVCNGLIGKTTINWPKELSK